jgi:succinate dehydrogenase / fumarate reductase, cytochrome b subunit
LGTGNLLFSMSLALTRESFFWHKVHSLTGIVPVGFYMVQHLTLNSFSLGGAEKFNAVIGFFEGIPIHLLLALEAVAIWIPLLFHAIYGLFITSRGEVNNYFTSKYKWSQARMYAFQRISGMFIFFFLIYHVLSTTGYKYMTGSAEVIEYAAMRSQFTSYGGLILLVYALGVLFSSYHLAYGIWNFCIRWGITISDRAQLRIQKFSLVFFVVVTLLGWAALGGFLMNRQEGPVKTIESATPELPQGTKI